MSRSAKGNTESPSKNIKARSGLNRVILDIAPSMFLDKQAYKAAWQGKIFVKVNPKHSSQTCSSCGHVDKNNRKSQAIFECTSCGYQGNADVNAAKNILARALASVH